MLVLKKLFLYLYTSLSVGQKYNGMLNKEMKQSIFFVIQPARSSVILHKVQVLSDILLPDDRYLPDGRLVVSADAGCGHSVSIGRLH